MGWFCSFPWLELFHFVQVMTCQSGENPGLPSAPPSTNVIPGLPTQALSGSLLTIVSASTQIGASPTAEILIVNQSAAPNLPGLNFMALSQLKEIIALRVVCCSGSEYPAQDLLAALRQQMKISF